MVIQPTRQASKQASKQRSSDCRFKGLVALAKFEKNVFFDCFLSGLLTCTKSLLEAHGTKITEDRSERRGKNEGGAFDWRGGSPKNPSGPTAKACF